MEATGNEPKLQLMWLVPIVNLTVLIELKFFMLLGVVTEYK
jgi:hypothetical protein